MKNRKQIKEGKEKANSFDVGNGIFDGLIDFGKRQDLGKEALSLFVSFRCVRKQILDLFDQIQQASVSLVVDQNAKREKRGSNVEVAVGEVGGLLKVVVEQRSRVFEHVERLEAMVEAHLDV